MRPYKKNFTILISPGDKVIFLLACAARRVPLSRMMRYAWAATAAIKSLENPPCVKLRRSSQPIKCSF